MSSPRGSAIVLLAAAAATLIFSLLPFGRVITYPFRIFVTYVHETSHVLATFATGGRAVGMNVSPDGSGVAYSRGGLGLIVSSAGYLGSTLLGGILLLLCGRPAVAGRTLAYLGAGTLGVTLFFVGFSLLPFLLTLALVGLGVAAASLVERSPGAAAGLGVAAAAVTVVLVFVLQRQGVLFAWLVGLALALGLFLAGIYLPPGLAHFLLGFLAVQCCLGAVVDLFTLVVLSAHSSVHSDAVNMQLMTGIPAIVWALAWTAVSITVLALTLRRFVALAAEPSPPALAP
jgi:hypothetical protein